MCESSMMRGHLVLGLGLCLAGAVGCKEQQSPQAASAQSAATEAADPTQGRAIYAARCVSCHGEGGRGDGPMADSLTPAPRDLSDPSWHKSVTDDYVGRIVVEGGEAVGKSADMPPHPDLGADHELLSSLIAYLRSLADGR